MEFINCDPSNKEFAVIQQEGRKLALKLNSLPITRNKQRKRIIEKLLGYVGKETSIYSPFHVDLGKNITIGNWSLINQNCIFLDTGSITIGSRTLIGPDVKIYTAVHDINYHKRYKKNSTGYEIQTTAKEVVIGDDVWIGGGSVILPGVHIGNGVVIGAGSVVVKNIPANCIAVGNPAKVIRYLEEENETNS